MKNSDIFALFPKKLKTNKGNDYENNNYKDE